MKKSYRVEAQPRMFEQVAKQIAEYIQTERLEPGTKLPTERQLSELLQVSRSSVREGLRVLELLHFLDSKQGEGTFVSTPPPFLIPSRVIDRNLENKAASHYLGIALMCAENIMTMAIQENHDYQDAEPKESLWENLLQFIADLGKRLENPYLAVLWSDTFGVVMESYLLSGKDEPFQYEELLRAYRESDLTQIKKLLNILSNSI